METRGLIRRIAKADFADVLGVALRGDAYDRPERQGATIRLTSNSGSRVLIEVLRALDDHDLAPATLAVREPSMDDVFIALAGHRPDGGAAPAEAGEPATRGGGAP